MEIKLVIELSDKTVAFIQALAGGTSAISNSSTTGATKKTPAKVAATPADTEDNGGEAGAPEAEEPKVVKMPTPAKPATAAPAKPAPAKPATAAPAKPAPAKPAAPAPAAKPATPAKPAPAKPAAAPAAAKPTAGQILAVPYEDKDTDEAKLEHLMALVTKHTKNGKGSDCKALLAVYSVDRASELAPEWYDSFYEAITRYGAGESVEEIFPTAE